MDEFLDLIESVSEGFPTYYFLSGKASSSRKAKRKSLKSLLCKKNVRPLLGVHVVHFIFLGPVVQSIVSLTDSLRGHLIKCFTTL